MAGPFDGDADFDGGRTTRRGCSMTIWTRLGLFAAIAMSPVLLDDIHDYFTAASYQQIASIQGR
ncbi:hypothetical protein amb2070 [Paramagnetospirillum magneticum AMB-1]|uniref:Uncharacterized protein n=1 Tax=Paramagnetospirillum magneticum (strain ATCC 700264 / AMB-1) TaxID=342108 RepID=Q2W5K1_PARM1|nr:hypothetical protein amb2070 [Paramagnetospirillum magneticum AMB-1]